MVSIWDKDNRNAVRFDLWTQDMMQDEMSLFVFQSLLMMADTYSNATNNHKLAEELRNFAEQFGIKARLIKKKSDGEITPFTLDL